MTDKERGWEIKAAGWVDQQEEWNRFLAEYEDWWNQVGHSGPVYVLPAPVLKALQPKSAGRKQTPLLTPDQAAAEWAFLNHCRKVGAVGVWDGRTICYGLPLLVEHPPFDVAAVRQLFEEQPDASTPPKADVMHQLDALYAAEDRANRHRLGMVGKLLFDERYTSFRSERDPLRAEWERLLQSCAADSESQSDRGEAPEQEILRFPWTASDGDRPPQTLAGVSSENLVAVANEITAFIKTRTEFMRRWEISCMATWDLLEMQGPLEEVSAGAARTVLGPDALVEHRPSYLDRPEDAKRQKRIRAGQRERARAAGIKAESYPVRGIGGREGHPSQYEQAYRYWIIERAFLHRYGHRRGLVEAMFRAASAWQKMQRRHFDRMRSHYKHELAQAAP